MKFNKQQIDQLRKAYEKIDRVDPNNPSYKTLIKLLDTLDQQQLKQLVNAKIKFVSKLAMNRLTKKESVNESLLKETTIYSHLDGAFADIMRIMKSKTKGKSVVWKNIKTITMSTWMAEYKGYSKSDLEITGYITFYDIPNKNSWQITVEVTHPMRGRNEKDFTFKMGENYTKYVEDAAAFITSYMNM